MQNTWQNIYYHYNKWSKDGSFEKLFSSSLQVIRVDLALECIQLDGSGVPPSHTPSKKGVKTLSGKEEKEHKP